MAPNRAADQEEKTKMTKRLSLTAQWMLDHPDDVPCPKPYCYGAAKAWRWKRGIGSSAKMAERRKLLEAEARRLAAHVLRMKAVR
jgi:hypothetical protein